jgi:hypothetical protein
MFFHVGAPPSDRLLMATATGKRKLRHTCTATW